MAAVFRVSPGLDVNSLSQHTTRFFPTADLASRSGLQPLRAESNQYPPSCGLQAPAFGGPRTGLSHYHVLPDTALRLLDNLGIEPKTVGLRGRCSTN